MKVLLAVDGSDTAAVAVDEVAQRRWPEGTEVKVVAVAEPVYPPGEALPAAASANYMPAMEVLADQAEHQASEVAARLTQCGLSSEWDVLYGDPSREIVACAQKWDADLVVLGTHGRTGLRRLMLGSVSEYVVRHAPCSVEVVRAKESHVAAEEAAAP